MERELQKEEDKIKEAEKAAETSAKKTREVQEATSKSIASTEEELKHLHEIQADAEAQLHKIQFGTAPMSISGATLASIPGLKLDLGGR